MVSPLAHARLEGDIAPRGRALSQRGLVLVVDDVNEVRRLVAGLLAREGYDVEAFESGEACLSAMARLMPDAVFLDLDMPGLSGLATLERIHSKNLRLPVIMLTADESVESVVAAMKVGAYDYLVKPAPIQKILTVARNAIEHYRMSLQLSSLHREAGGKNGYPEIVTQASVMKGVFRQMDRVAASDVTLLVFGESGTGKELVARAIHGNSARAGGPFVALNCAAIPETLQESELFGHEKGAFTGATGQRIGKFELANKGTLFLDEVGELSLSLQAKLLRVLQDGTFQRVGGSHEIRSDFRLIAATHRDMAREVSAGRFREDLYFRIVVFELDLPPLRERVGDVVLLTRFFLEQHIRKCGTEIRMTREADERLRRYSWPGNVRELENAIQRAVVCTESGVIEPQHLPTRIRGCSYPVSLTDERSAATAGSVQDRGVKTPPESALEEGTLNLERLEESAIKKALQRTRGNIAEVGRLLGVSRATLYRKLKKYSLR